MAILSPFERRRRRVRTALKARAGGKPRLSVHRSGRHIYVQLIDDAAGKTVASASTLDKDLRAKSGANVDAAVAVGKRVAEAAVKAGITKVVFDRGGFLFHGRVKALADAAREADWSSNMADETQIEGAAPGVEAPAENQGQGRGRGRGRGERGERGGRGRRDDRRGRNNNDDDGGEEFVEKLVHINRVSKTVKGGKRFGFAALVVVGDGKGRVGFGHGKAREVPEAISKATASAKKAMVRVPLKEGRTLHHDGRGHFGAGKVTVRSAPAGTGIIAGGPMRAVFESLGVADVVTKSVGTSNPYNMIRATFEALTDQTSPKSVSQRRGKKVADLLRRGGTSAEVAQADAEAIVE